MTDEQFQGEMLANEAWYGWGKHIDADTKISIDWLAANLAEWPILTPKIIPPGDAIFENGATFYEDSVQFE
jgi:hypothetical protein